MDCFSFHEFSEVKEAASFLFGKGGYSSQGSEVRYTEGSARFGQGAGSQCFGRPVRTEPDDADPKVTSVRGTQANFRKQQDLSSHEQKINKRP